MNITTIPKQGCYALDPIKVTVQPQDRDPANFYLKVVLLVSCPCSKK